MGDIVDKKSLVSNLTKGAFQKISKLADNPYQQFGISWMDLRKLKNTNSGKLFTQKFLNGSIQFFNPIEFLHGVEEIFYNEIYKIDLRKNAVILDCGGHIGLSAIYFKHHHPDAQLTVFEPDEKNFELLKKNISLQGFSDIVLRKEAVWIENTTLSFLSEGDMSSKISETDNDSPQRVQVNASRLKDYIDREIDLLKMDIEGAEFKVLEDIEEKFHLIKNMFIEYHGFFNNQDELLQIFGWLQKHGFTFYIKEALDVFPHPFVKNEKKPSDYEVQLNIFCSKK